jgi:hypothetical protein
MNTSRARRKIEAACRRIAHASNASYFPNFAADRFISRRSLTVKLSAELKAALKDMPSDITVAQARLALIAQYIPLDQWEELSKIENAKGADHPLKRRKYRCLDDEPPLPALPSPPPVPPKPEYTCVKCGGANVSQREWRWCNPPPGWRPGQSLWDHEASECLDYQYYCHDCDELFNDINHNGV